MRIESRREADDGISFIVLPVEPVYAVVKNSLKPLIKHGLDWTIEGAHGIPGHGPVILASSHSSYIDPLVLAHLADVRRRKARFLAKRELFEKRGLGWPLRKMGQIPVDRGTGDAAAALQAARDALGDGKMVVIFPEGTISLDLDPMPGKTGTARLARMSGVPVTPVGLWGGHRVLFKGRDPNWKWGIAQVACVGPPISVGPDDDLREATDRIMEGVCAQVRRAREIYPQDPAEGEDDWWVRPPESAVLRSCRDEAAPSKDAEASPPGNREAAG